MASPGVKTPPVRAMQVGPVALPPGLRVVRRVRSLAELRETIATSDHEPRDDPTPLTVRAARDVRSAGSEPRCPACAAQSRQGTHPYDGVDNWRNARVAAGTVLVALGSAVNGFFTTAKGLRSVDHDVTRYCAGLQIAPCPPGARCVITVVRTVRDLTVATSVALANPQHGAGGLPQVYVPRAIRPWPLRRCPGEPGLLTVTALGDGLTANGCGEPVAA